MTEAEWLACDDPMAMLSLLRDRTPDRKYRLYSCAACRSKWHWFDGDEGSRQAIEVAERYADGEASKAALAKATKALPRGGGVALHVTLADGSSGALNVADVMVGEAVSECLGEDEHQDAKNAENTAQARLVRCIFGNPFRPVTIDPSWLTPTVVSLATGIYQERAFDRMPILADALQDAGCTNEEVLSHCRGAGPHVRGCWVVDGVLGKE
jgi:hypothetical protein